MAWNKKKQGEIEGKTLDVVLPFSRLKRFPKRAKSDFNYLDDDTETALGFRYHRRDNRNRSSPSPVVFSNVFERAHSQDLCKGTTAPIPDHWLCVKLIMFPIFSPQKSISKSSPPRGHASHSE